ncbi:hypothetical protein R6Q59_018805 [Mikania micrantha]
MDPLNQEVMPDDTVIGSKKRKRGRPRKDLSEKRAQRAQSQPAASIPPDFTQAKNTPRVDLINNPTESMVGQIVTGVVQATFDAGYLLAVRIGNSKITLTGAVFKPGHTAPVTPENDVAPHVEMIKRTEVPFPTELQPKRRRKRRSKEKNMQLVTYVGSGPDPVISNSSPRTDHVLSPSIPQVGARGTVVPVVLQPINLSNGISTNQPAPHLRASHGKPVHSVLPLAVFPPNRSASQASDCQTGSHTDVGKTVKSSDVHDRVVKTESDIGDMNEPLFVEPLQTRHVVHHFQTPPGLGGMMHGGTGRMTELLQAVQQNMGDDQVSRNGHPTASYNESGQAGRI